MKNTFNRISTFASVLFYATPALLFSIFLISHFSPGSPAEANLKITWISDNPNYKSLFFEPNIDLTPQFKFNTKQIILYLNLKSTMDSGTVKEELVWFRNVQNGADYKIFSTEKSKYTFSGNGKNKYEIELRGNIFPYVGRMMDVSYGTLDYNLN